MTQTTILLEQSLKEFAQSGSFKTISNVIQSKDKFPCVILSKDNNRDNDAVLVLSKNAGLVLKAGDKPQVFKDFNVRILKYEDGTERIKLCSPSTNTSVDELWD